MGKINVFDILKLVISLVICQFAGFIGSVFTTPSIPTWYATLNKPFFTPPNWLFAPVWTTLFVLMGVSLFLVWRRSLESREVKTSIGIFIFQLILNTLWSIVFFGLRSPIAGLIVISILWIAILLTILKFYRISRTAGAILIPYILWVSLAAVLNFAIFTLNP